MKPISLARLKDVIAYNGSTGEFVWEKRTGNRVKAGDKAGRLYVNGRTKYRQIDIDNHTYPAAHLAWMYIHGVWPCGEIDHINGNGADNRISNLRDVSRRENGMNQRRNSNNTSGARGVSWCNRSNKWIARIAVDGVRKYLGSFTQKGEAIKKIKLARIECGYHPNHDSVRLP